MEVFGAKLDGRLWGGEAGASVVADTLSLRVARSGAKSAGAQYQMSG